MEDKRPVRPVRVRPLSTADDEVFNFPARNNHGRKTSLAGGDFSGMKKAPNAAAFHQDTARRLAQVIEAQNVADDEDEDLYDDLGLELGSLPPLLVASRRTHRPPSSSVGQNIVEPTPILSASIEQTLIEAQPSTVAPEGDMPERSPLTTPKAGGNQRFLDIGNFSMKDPEKEPEEDALHDDLDALLEENENLLQKLREAEKKCEATEARERFLEGQVASLGEGAHRKQEGLRQREEALRAARQSRGNKEEIGKLRSEIKNLTAEVAETTHKLQETESEAKSLRAMRERIILTHEEMEEVVLKRCWLARYWGLAVQYGICEDIAELKHESWSEHAPLPFEVVISAGEKAKEDFLNKGEKSNGWSKSLEHGDPIGKGNIESMLFVEMGLKEMSSLKIEDGVMLSMVQQRRPALIQDSNAAGSFKFTDSFKLSQEESNDVLFKEAWLIYYWKRAKDYGVEEDIADERLELWVSRIGQSPTLQDAVDVERGLIQLKKLGIQQLLWEASRKAVSYPSLIESDYEIHSAESENSS